MKEKAVYETCKILNTHALIHGLLVTQDTEILELVTRLLPTPLIERIAQPVELVKRRRKVALIPLGWTLLLAVCVTPNPSLAHLHRLFSRVTGHTLSSSSFYNRLTPQLTDLFSSLLRHVLARERGKTSHWLEKHLTGFKQVLALDSSGVALRDGLRDGLRDTYTACTKAGSALKLHAVINAITHTRLITSPSVYAQASAPQGHPSKD